jgi:hypothetical protein
MQGADLIPARVRNAYFESLGAFNARLWNATAISCRRTLEGIIQDISPQGKGVLANQIKTLSTTGDLGKSLIVLADMVRSAGNIGAHFDAQKEADKPTAQAMLDLLEYLLEYVYILPAMVAELDKRISMLGTPAPPTGAKGKQWDEETFFEELAKRRSADDVRVAREILNWSQDKALRSWWGRGYKFGSFFPMLDYEGKIYWLFAIWTGGGVEIQFQMMLKTPPFDNEAKRQDLRRRLNQIPGVNINEMSITKRPSIPLSALKNEAALRQFLGIFAWVVDEIKTQEPPVKSHNLRLKFWKQLLDRAVEKGVIVHARRSPTKDHWLGAGSGRSGITFNYLVFEDRAGIELWIATGDTARNKRVFDALHVDRAEIEAKLGNTLQWERLDNKQASRVRLTLQHGGLRSDEDIWPSIQEAMIDAMSRFTAILKPFVQALPNR